LDSRSRELRQWRILSCFPQSKIDENESNNCTKIAATRRNPFQMRIASDRWQRTCTKSGEVPVEQLHSLAFTADTGSRFSLTIKTGMLKP
jgi:hypothetical protein